MQDQEKTEAGGRPFRRRRICRFCAEPTFNIDYKDVPTMRLFASERGKLVARRISGNCAKHQREIATAVKRARMLALLPFTVETA